MSRVAASALGGLVFAFGLGLSGMTDANKVIAFLDLSGDWDPSLALVMVGAIVAHFALYRFVVRRPSPLLDTRFYIPDRNDITPSLVVGSALFGVGWGLGGYCPGPALVSAVTLGADVLVFVGCMLGGMALHRLWRAARSVQPARGAS